MGLFSKLTHKNKGQAEPKTGGMEDFMTLVRVYFQAAIAGKVGITNLSALPDLRIFKQTFKVATVNNRLGQGEQKYCRKLLKDIYGVADIFFDEVDQSIKKNCRSMQDVQSYMYMFQGYSQDLLMLLSSMLKFKLRIPAIFKKTLRGVVEKGVHDVFNKTNWKDGGERKSAYGLRQLQTRLGFSEPWATEYAYRIVMLAKKEPRRKNDDDLKDIKK